MPTKKAPALFKLNRVPTNADVTAVCNWMFILYSVPMVDKRSAPEMKLVASILHTFGILEPDEFMERYSSYVFGRVYLPFKPTTTGQPGSEILTIVHEYGHAFQDRRAGKGLEFEIDYLDTKKRATIEAECYALGPCLSIRYPFSFVQPEVLVARAIGSFRSGYGAIPASHLAIFDRELRRRVDQYRDDQQPFNQHLRDVTNLLDRMLVRRAP